MFIKLFIRIILLILTMVIKFHCFIIVFDDLKLLYFQIPLNNFI